MPSHSGGHHPFKGKLGTGTRFKHAAAHFHSAALAAWIGRRAHKNFNELAAAGRRHHEHGGHKHKQD
jgi:hypothetical protein